MPDPSSTSTFPARSPALRPSGPGDKSCDCGRSHRYPSTLWLGPPVRCWQHRWSHLCRELCQVRCQAQQRTRSVGFGNDFGLGILMLPHPDRHLRCLHETIPTYDWRFESAPDHSLHIPNQARRRSTHTSHDFILRAGPENPVSVGSSFPSAGPRHGHESCKCLVQQREELAFLNASRTAAIQE
jgi:hypothetical protein